MEGVLGLAAMGGGISQGADDLHEFDDRARPAMGDDQRQGVLVFRAHVQEMDVEAVDGGLLLAPTVQHRLAGPRARRLPRSGRWPTTGVTATTGAAAH